MPRYIDADALLRNTIYNPSHVPYIAESDVIFMPTADVVERKRGKWIEKEVMSVDEGKAIDEWQSCRCSVCGRYDTRPYMYYFDEPHFCSWCGAEME